MQKIAESALLAILNPFPVILSEAKNPNPSLRASETSVAIHLIDSVHRRI